MTKKKFYYQISADVLQPDGESIPIWFNKKKLYLRGQKYSLISSNVTCYTRKESIRIIRCLWTMVGSQYKVRVRVEKSQLKTHALYKVWEYSWGTKYWDKDPYYFSSGGK